MTDDLELEARLRAHYRAADPGPAPVGWTRRVDRALDRRARPASAPWRLAMLAAAAVLVAVGIVGGSQLLERLVATAGPDLSAQPATALASPAQPTSALDAALVDLVGTFGSHGIWAIRGDRLFVSGDGGATWRAGAAPTAVSPGGSGPRAAAMIDADRAWVVTSGPGTAAFDGAAGDVQPLVVHRTADGGRTWSSTTLSGNYPGVSVSIAFASGAQGFVFITPLRGSSTPGTVLATSDGGATWRVQGTSDTWATGGMQPWLGSEFGVSDASTLWAGANQEAGPVQHPLLAVSSDGGATWREAVLPGLEGRSGGAQAYLPAPPLFHGPASGLVAVVDTAGQSAVTDLFNVWEYPDSWMNDGSVSQETATGVMALSVNHWLLAGLNPSDLVATRDGGNWTPLSPTGLPDGWRALAGGAADATHAWLEIASTDSSLDPGILMLSGDSGETWRPADFGVPTPVAPATPASPSPSPTQPAAPSERPAASPPGAAASPASGDVLDVQPLLDGPRGTTQVVRWPGGWLALTDAPGSPGWVSQDGRVWNAIVAGTFGDVSSIEGAPLGDGLLVAVEDPNGVQTGWWSLDGHLWGRVWTSEPGASLALVDDDIAGGGGTVVGIRNRGTPGVLATRDGVHWQSGATDDGSAFRPQSVAFVDGPQLTGFVAVGDDGSAPAAWTSTDGVHWRGVAVGRGDAVGLSGLVAGREGLVAAGHTDTAPGLTTYWVGAWTDGRLTFSESPADPLGAVAGGEGAGSAIGNVTGDGSRILSWGRPDGQGPNELWSSADGQRWQQIELTGTSLGQDVGEAYPLGDAVLFSAGDRVQDWLGTSAGR